MRCRDIDRIAGKQTWSLEQAFADVSAGEDLNRRQRRRLGRVLRDLPTRHRVVISGLLADQTQREIGAKLGIRQPAVSNARRRAIATARYLLDRPGAVDWPDSRVRAELDGVVDAELLAIAIDFASGQTSGPLARRFGVSARKLRDLLRGFTGELRDIATPAARVLADRLDYRRSSPPAFAGSAWARGRRLRPERPRRPLQLDLFRPSYRASGNTTHPN